MKHLIFITLYFLISYPAQAQMEAFINGITPNQGIINQAGSCMTNPGPGCVGYTEPSTPYWNQNNTRAPTAEEIAREIRRQEVAQKNKQEEERISDKRKLEEQRVNAMNISVQRTVKARYEAEFGPQ